VADAQDNPTPQTDLTPGWSETILKWVIRKRLQVPAVMLLEMHRPLMPLTWTAAMLASGLVAPLVGPDYYKKIEALRNPAVLDRMLARLEASAKDGVDPGPDVSKPPEKG